MLLQSLNRECTTNDIVLQYQNRFYRFHVCHDGAFRHKHISAQPEMRCWCQSVCTHLECGTEYSGGYGGWYWSGMEDIAMGDGIRMEWSQQLWQGGISLCWQKGWDRSKEWDKLLTLVWQQLLCLMPCELVCFQGTGNGSREQDKSFVTHFCSPRCPWCFANDTVQTKNSINGWLS